MPTIFFKISDTSHRISLGPKRSYYCYPSTTFFGAFYKKNLGRDHLACEN